MWSTTTDYNNTISSDMGTVDSPLVLTENGPVEGFRYSTENGDVNVFLGIPYAQPPVDEFRLEVGTNTVAMVSYLLSLLHYN